MNFLNQKRNSQGMALPEIIIPGNDGSTRKRLGMWVRPSTRPNGAASGVSNADFAAHIDWVGWKYVQVDLPNNHEFYPDGIRF